NRGGDVGCWRAGRRWPRWGRGLGLGLLGWGLVGCVVGPEVEAPPMVVAATYRSGSEGRGESAANRPWEEVFRDEILQGLIVEALRGNQDLAGAVARVDQFRAGAKQQEAALFPQVGLGGDAGVQGVRGGPPLTQRGGVGRYGLGLQMSWEVDLWGRLRRLNESARARFRQQERLMEAVQVSLIGQVAQTYFVLAGLDEQLALAKATIAARERALSIAEARKEGGAISGLDLQRFVADVASAKNQRLAIERGVAQTENLLSLLLGRNPGPVKRGRDPLSGPLAGTLPPGLPAELLRRRPDVLAAEQALVAANAEIGAAIANQFPRVSLEATLGLASPNLLQTVGGLLQLDQYVFDGGARAAEVELRRAVFREAHAGYVKTVLGAVREVEDALVAFRTFRSQIAELERQVGSLSTALGLAQARYEAGVSSYLEVVNAQQELFGAQLGLAEARAQRAVAYASVYQALGGGWSAGPAQAAEGVGGGRSAVRR
ncbi:MAG: efflux transporter outer membrane subunit, partial [Verrucomicrobiia bacterium]